MTEKIDKAAASVVAMVIEWCGLEWSDARKGVLEQLVAMRLERFWPSVEDSCGCVFCDIDLEPFKAEGIEWHQANGREPVRCTRIPTPATVTGVGG